MGSGASTEPGSDVLASSETSCATVTLQDLDSDDFHSITIDEIGALESPSALADLFSSCRSAPARLEMDDLGISESSSSEFLLKVPPELRTSIVALSLSKNNIRLGATSFHEAMQACGHFLLELNLSENPNLFAPPIPIPATNPLSPLVNLINLDMSFTTIIEKSSLQLLLSSLTKLQKLSLEACELDSLSVNDEKEKTFIMSNLSSLVELNLQDNKLADLKALSDLGSLSLTQIDLRDNDVTTTANYRKGVTKMLPLLERLDGQPTKVVQAKIDESNEILRRDNLLENLTPGLVKEFDKAMKNEVDSTVVA